MPETQGPVLGRRGSSPGRSPGVGDPAPFTTATEEASISRQGWRHPFLTQKTLDDAPQASKGQVCFHGGRSSLTSLGVSNPEFPSGENINWALKDHLLPPVLPSPFLCTHVLAFRNSFRPQTPLGSHTTPCHAQASLTCRSRPFRTKAGRAPKARAKPQRAISSGL